MTAPYNPSVVRIESRMVIAKQGLAVATWLRAIDLSVRQHWPVMPVPIDLSQVDEVLAARLLMNPQLLADLISEMESLKHKHIFQMETSECLMVQGTIIGLKECLPLKQAA